MKRFASALALLILSTPSAARAGSIVWIENVYLQGNFDRETGQSSLTVYATPFPKPIPDPAIIGVADLTDFHSPGGEQLYEVLIQTNGPLTLKVMLAEWGFDVNSSSDTLGLSVYSYASSPNPPQLTAPPVGLADVGEFIITPGDYSADPFKLATFAPGAYLIATYGAIEYTAPYIVLSASAPEPSSLVLLAVGLGVVLLWKLSRSA